jgi:3-methylcrotonyl-CoA carboxylase alpha subunit
LPLAADAIPRNGHAIEVRLYAEDPAAGFLPGSGRLERLRLPAPSAHVRIDSGVVEGDTVTIHYDPMIAKLIVHDADRPRALARLRDALADCAIEGPKSNIAFLERLVRHPAVVDGTIDTSYLDRHLDEFLPGPDAAPARDLLAAAATARLLRQEADTAARAAASTDPGSPWALADGWRLGHAGARPIAFLHGETERRVVAHGHAGHYRLEIDGDTVDVAAARFDGDALELRLDGTRRRLRAWADARQVLVHDGAHRLAMAPVEVYRSQAGAAGAGADRVLAPMPGRVVVVRAAAGDQVTEGQELLVLEAMKMELALKAPRDGTVAEVRAAEGEFVEADAALVVLEPAGEA